MSNDSNQSEITPQDIAYMERAMQLAANVWSTTPNPRVGCVVVTKDNIVVGEGWHKRAGQAHAEINALEQAGDKAKGATLYVTLEPCFHTGKTGPCCEAVISAGVSRVVLASIDPNPKVAGQSIERLQHAGIEVSHSVLDEKSQLLNRGYIKRMTGGLPFVTCKMAMSLDGRTAMASGESQWITGPSARADVQKLRASSCAILTSVNTVLADDPGLNVRAEQLDVEDAELVARRQPLRAIIDSSLRTPPDSKIVNLAGDVVFFVDKPDSQQYQRFEGKNVNIHTSTTQVGRVNLLDAMKTLAGQYECNEVLLEAGPTLSGSMIEAGLVDEVIVYIGAKFLGSDALPLFNLPGLKTMADQIKLEIVDVVQISGDCRITATVVNTGKNQQHTDLIQ